MYNLIIKKIALFIPYLFLFMVTNQAFCADNSNFETLLQKAKNGDSEAQVELGNYFFEKKAYFRARLYYEFAAKSDNAVAQNKLGNIYHEGLGVDKNLFKAKSYYEQAAQNGNKYAQYNLGNAYYHGEGCNVDIDEAFKWLNLSCKSGYKKACETFSYIASKEKGKGKSNPPTQYADRNQSDVEIVCAYRRDTGIGEGLGAISEILGFFTGMKAEIGSAAAEIFSNTEDHVFACAFSPNVRKFSAAYFFTDPTTNARFREKENHSLSPTYNSEAIKFSKMAPKSILDFLTIRADADINGEIVKTLYVYQIDRENDRLIPIDTKSFLNDVVDQYEMR